MPTLELAPRTIRQLESFVESLSYVVESRPEKNNRRVDVDRALHAQATQPDIVTEMLRGTLWKEFNLSEAFVEHTDGKTPSMGEPDHVISARNVYDQFVGGVDISEQMVMTARSAHPNVRFSTGSLTELPISNPSITAAMFWYSIIQHRATNPESDRRKRTL